ncbi:bifunctional DNA primase/polymerase [Streptomyces sp. Ru87]|uniref:bifunctional DNA primase/polymerase n=1 Tax=Streptomyces sp. Ru87 TaxID=2044307 RepID=UPI000BF33814|nr:bifunctional DNA primase/polymerase [Streptomyces sp. Ru87]PGH46914.1 DNA primase [Streptomyces sp. Ru87]
MPYPSASALPRTALAAAERGWHVFPLIPGDKRPAITSWETRATTDPDRIARCWAHAPYNIGIAAGPSNLVVVDLDKPKHPDETSPDGADTFRALCQEKTGTPHPPETYTVATGSGGAHLYFTAPQGEQLRNSAGKLAPKVDTRAHGGYVVAAGSIVGGRPYAVTLDTEPAPLPGWLAELLHSAPLPPQRPIAVPLATDRRGAYLRAAVTAELERVTTSPPDGHNNALYLAAVALGQLVAGGALAEDAVTAWLADAAAQVRQKPGETQRTIRSGLRAGARRPRQVAA